MIRVSYPDLIGVDRGRDVLLDMLPSAMEHGLAFCRAVYHTSPMGDVVPVDGGLEAGLPDIHVVPDLSSLTALPWEPHAAWCIGEAFTPDGRWRRYADDPGNVYVVGRKGDPQGLLLHMSASSKLGTSVAETNG